jgi:hypothetical protein
MGMSTPCLAAVLGTCKVIQMHLHVTEGPCKRACVLLCLLVLKELFANSKVTQLGQAQVRLNENIVRLQISVYLLALVVQKP